MFGKNVLELFDCLKFDNFINHMQNEQIIDIHDIN